MSFFRVDTPTPTPPPQKKRHGSLFFCIQLSIKYISHFEFTSQIFLRTYLIMKHSFIVKVSVIFYVNANSLKMCSLMF